MEEKAKTTMSVPEMQRMLGLCKTESYWLVHRGYLIPSPTGYDVIKYIEWEINQGNLGYMYNGVYYSTPYDDPEYDDTWCI